MSHEPTLTFYGAAGTVTGSCMALHHGGETILVDCGLFQGSRTLEALNYEPFGFDLRSVGAVILTHAHIDHSGLLPRLIAEGYRGQIFTTPETRDLLYYMLPDSGRIQEGEAERRNRRRDRKDEDPIKPIYTEADARTACAQVKAVELHDWFKPAAGFRARLWNAGHILGSASVEIDVGGTRLFFSGDLGPDHKAFHADAEGPSDLDHVLCESTYGNRIREDMTLEQRRTLLESEIKAALTRGGNLIIPVFALERTQELLFDIATLINTGRLAHPHVFIDSPLATRATEVFAKHQDAMEDIGTGEIFHHPSFHYTASPTESMRLNNMSGAIILAASGMCEAGRVRHHLRHNLWRTDSTILFVGFQATGSLGRTILDGANRVRIWGQDVSVSAQIRQIDTYSAHADQEDLQRWIRARQPIKGSLFLNHGEGQAIEALRRLMQAENVAGSIITPQIGEVYSLPTNAPARRLKTGTIRYQEAVGRDWQNDYADFATSLKKELQAIDDPSARRKALADMKKLLYSYQSGHQKRTG
ncbi:MBL fold metallo-hydrolase RNA specificity domain-containing protein [Castellaniella sp.]|uniref:MBL fold metallo-hydrolase RNA specificity domain-containing protein n=1 Tax=Castellaniella sp. TaxID=1955812 RepID=UPI003A9213B9